MRVIYLPFYLYILYLTVHAYKRQEGNASAPDWPGFILLILKRPYTLSIVSYFYSILLYIYFTLLVLFILYYTSRRLPGFTVPIRTLYRSPALFIFIRFNYTSRVITRCCAAASSFPSIVPSFHHCTLPIFIYLFCGTRVLSVHLFIIFAIFPSSLLFISLQPCTYLLLLLFIHLHRSSCHSRRSFRHTLSTFIALIIISTVCATRTLGKLPSLVRRHRTPKPFLSLFNYFYFNYFPPLSIP